MAYGEIYYLTITSLQGRTFDVSIEKDGYLGYPKEITVFPGRSPIVIEYDNDEKIYKPVRSSTLTLSISTSESGLDIDELTAFISAENRDFKITVNEGSDVIWTGWLQPMDQLTLDLFGIGQLDLIFVDGLVQLRNVDAPIDIEDSFEFWKIKEYIRQCLLQTGHTFDIQLISSINDDNVPVWDHFGFVKAVFLRSDSGGYIDCLSLLELVLSKICCTVYQKDGKWFVQNMMEGEATSAKGSLLNSDGTGGTTLTTYTRAIDDLLLNRSFLSRNGQARLFNPVQTISVKAEYLSNRNGVPNFNFDLWTGANTDAPDGWTLQDSLEVLRQSSINRGTQYSTFLRGYYKELDGGAVSRFMENIGSNVNEGDKIIIGWEWEYLTFIGGDTPIGRVLFFLDADEGGTFDRYLAADGSWTSTFTTLNGQSNKDVAAGDMVVTIPYQGRLIVQAYNPEATTAVGEDQTVYYVRLWYLGYIHIKQGENDENLYTFSRFPNLLVRSTYQDTFSNSRPDPVNVVGYEALNSTEMVEPNLTTDVINTFLGSERDGNDNFRLVDSTINSDYIDGNLSTMNKFITWQILSFIRSNRFYIQGDFVQSALNIGESYTYEIFENEQRIFICVSYKWDLKNDVYTTAVLPECNLLQDVGFQTQNIFE